MQSEMPTIYSVLHNSSSQKIVHVQQNSMNRERSYIKKQIQANPEGSNKLHKQVVYNLTAISCSTQTKGVPENFLWSLKREENTLRLAYNALNDSAVVIQIYKNIVLE